MLAHPGRVLGGDVTAPVSMVNDYGDFWFYAAHLAETGYPFFSGSVTFEKEIEADGTETVLELPGRYAVAKVEIGGETVDAQQTMICVCNGRFYGGGFNPVPEADPTDGLLDVLLVKKVSRLQVSSIIGKYKNGRYKDYPDVIRHFRTDSVKILCDKPTAINLDGELRTSDVVNISVAQEKVRFFYPKDLSWQAKEPAHC